MSLADCRRVRGGPAFVLAIVVALFWWSPTVQAAADDEHPFAQRVAAPSLDGGVEWINTAGPIDLRQLRGRFVVLDFWTYCCINCMHVLPELKKLERAYPNEIVVIGVHSAKFENEQDSKNIAEAVERYEIEHPVINDARHVIWNKYGVSSWPTLCVIDPGGELVVRQGGEVDFATLDAFFKQVMPYYQRHNLLKPAPPLPTGAAAGRAVVDMPLRFPGKVLADEKSDRLFIADSNHNRVVVAQLDGTLVETIGSGQLGAADGGYAEAQFDHPQGMALDGDTLYVADTENHLLRKVDLKTRQVSTLAGTGQQGHGWPRMGDFQQLPPARQARFRFVGPARKTDLNSPWALWVHDRHLYVAMAGPHQIWKMSLAKDEIGPFAGNGREDIVDGPHLPSAPYALDAASFAQPSGLSSDGKVLFVADSEGSSIRAVPFDPAAEVTTVVGTQWAPQGRLFLFGDQDGQGQEIRLQHALGVLHHAGQLYVADTYNNKIKRVDLKNLTCTTIAGSGKPGSQDDPPQFDEPAGLAYAAGKLYVADTNNHAIRTIDLAHGSRVATLEIAGLEPPAPPEGDARPTFPEAVVVDLPARRLKVVDGKVRLHVDIKLPEGYKINPQAPLRYLVESTADGGPVGGDLLGKLRTLEKPAAAFDIELPASAASGSQPLKVSVGYYYCRDGSEGVCKAGSVAWNLPLTLADDATAVSIDLPYQVFE